MPGPAGSVSLAADHRLKGFDATRIIWDFFKRFRRAGAAAVAGK